MGIYNLDGNAINEIYNIDSARLNTAYNTNGEIVYRKSGGVDYDVYTISSFLTINISNSQGFDVYNNTMFQFRATGSTIADIMNVYNITNGSAIATGVAVDSDHGDSASFSEEFYNVSDAFPLLYVTSDTNPALVYVNRVTTSSASLIRTLAFPIAQAGYYAAAACDFKNDTIYMVGYTEQKYLTDDGGANKTLISKWDLSDLTNNGDGTYTPRFITSITRDFIYCTQGQQFHDGMIWAASGYTNHAGYIYAVNPTTGSIEHTIGLNTTTEVEGLAWLDDNSIVVGYQGGAYQKITFGNT